MPPERTACYQQREWQLSRKNTSFTLVKAVGCSAAIGNAKRVGHRCVGQPEQLRSEDHITWENPSAPWCDGRRGNALIASKNRQRSWKNRYRGDLLAKWFTSLIIFFKTLVMTSLALRGHHEHAGDSDCHGGNFVALNRQGPQMRYCLWAPECDATPLAAVHMCSAWSASRYRGWGEVHNEVWQGYQRHMHHL